MKVNFEFPEGKLGAVVPALATLTIDNTLSIYGNIGGQYLGKAETTSSDNDWYQFCVDFNQECVALYDETTGNGFMVGPKARQWTFNKELFNE